VESFKLRSTSGSVEYSINSLLGLYLFESSSSLDNFIAWKHNKRIWRCVLKCERWEKEERDIYLRFGDAGDVVEKNNDAVVAADAAVSERVRESECYGLKRWALGLKRRKGLLHSEPKTELNRLVLKKSGSNFTFFFLNLKFKIKIINNVVIKLKRNYTGGFFFYKITPEVFKFEVSKKLVI